MIPTLNEEYLQRVRDRLSSVAREGPQTTQQLIRQSQGAFPTVVVEALKGMVLESSQLTALSAQNPLKEHRLRELEGNPALCSWYFSTACCERLLGLRNWEGKDVAFLGCPRLFGHFVQHDEKSVGQLSLLDLDKTVVGLSSSDSDVAQARLYDVREPLPADVGKFDFVFFDPPWYVEAYPVWLKRAAGLLRQGGTLGFSLFPELTRPTASVERQEILELVTRASDHYFQLAGFLEYDVPTYERAQLDTQGLGWLSNWKLSDLVLARFHFPPAWPETDNGPSVEEWTELNVGPLRVFVARSSASSASDALCTSLPSGSIVLTSPSRRDPDREAANVLTSRGHGLVAPNPERFVRAIQQIKDAHDSGYALDLVLQRLDAEESSVEHLCVLFGEVFHDR